MGLQYNHLTRVDRSHLQYLLEQGIKKREIAKIIGCDVSTIYREIKRNIQMFRKNTTYNTPQNSDHT